MSFLHEFLADVQLPPMYRVRQHFDESHLEDLPGEVEAQLGNAVGLPDLEGRSIGIALGSRGIASIAEVTRSVVSWLKARGAVPFIVPAMGSHGGATPEGQTAVLAHFGITERSMGVPVRASMAVRPLGELYAKTIYWSEEALAADHLILVNRIKLHTAFRGPTESGLIKMLAVGLGKREGAETLHGLGPERFRETIPAFAEAILPRVPPITGLALIENAHRRICHVEAVPAADFWDREPELLQLACRHMPRFLVDRFDVLVVDEIGKNISGDGMDPNITGRYCVSHISGGAAIGKIVVLGLSEETAGNGNGIGLADYTTQRVLDAIDWDLTYVNALSGMTTTTIKRPFAAASAEEAIKLAIKTATAFPERVRLIHIRNTLEMADIMVSEALLEPLLATGRVTVVEGPLPHPSMQVGQDR